MNVKEASTAVIELMKLEKALEPTCKDCEQCAVLKKVKDEIINISAFIVYEQSRKILSLTRKALGQQDDPEMEKALDRLERLIENKTVTESPVATAILDGTKNKGDKPPPDKSGLN